MDTVLRVAVFEHAGQARHRTVDGHITVGAPHDVFSLLTESAFLGTGITFIPNSSAAPDPACPLNGICNRRQLSPVNEHADGRTGLCDTPALMHPFCTPVGEASLILCVAFKCGRCVLTHTGILLCCGFILLCLCSATRSIGRICDNSIEAACGIFPKQLQCVAVDDLPRLSIQIIFHAYCYDSPLRVYFSVCRRILLSNPQIAL